MTTAATVKDFGAPAAVRRFLSWTVTLARGGGPRAAGLPALIGTGFPEGLDVGSAYSVTVGRDTALGRVIDRFTSAYLSGPSSDLESVVTADSGLAALGTRFAVNIHL